MENKLITEIFPGITKKKLIMIISSLSQEIQRSVYIKYGDDLDKCVTKLNDQDNYMVKKAIYRIKTYLEKEKLYSTFNSKELKEAFPKLKEESKEILTKVYGESLNKYNEYQLLNFTRMEAAMKDVARNSTKRKSVDNNRYPVMEEYYSKYPVRYVDKAISLLSKIDKDMVRKIELGELEIGKNVPFSLTNKITKILESMNIDWGCNYYNDVRHELHVDIDRLPRNEIDDIIDNELDIRSKSIIDKVRNNEELTKVDMNRYKKVIKIICNRIKQKKYVETIFRLCSEYSREEVLNAIDSLTDNSKRKIELRYGSDLDNPRRSEDYTKDDGEEFAKKVLPELKIVLETRRNSIKPVKLKVDPAYFKKKEDKDNEFRHEMFQKYCVLFNETLSSTEILGIIDTSIKECNNDIAREKYILNQLNNYMKKLVDENGKVFEQIFINNNSQKKSHV